MKKPKAAKPAKVKPVKAKTSTGKPNPKKKPPAKHHVHVPAAVRVKRHAAAVKAAKTRAVNAKKAKAHPRRKLALGSAVACCSAEAVAASLRLAGHAVTDSDVLALYWHTARDEHAGASILATLEAAAEFGLAGVRPVSFRAVGPDETVASLLTCEDAIRDSHNRRSGAGPANGAASLLLGLELPGPHAVADDGGCWWSWGERWPAWAFPDAAIEEAWSVTWEAP